MPSNKARNRGFLSRAFPERELYVRSNGSVRYLTLSPFAQASLAVLVASFTGWAAFAAYEQVLAGGRAAYNDQAIVEVKEAYEARVRKVQDRYARLEAELTEAERRFDQVMRQLSGKHGQLEGAAGVEVALQGRLDASQRRLSEVTEQRDDALTKLEDLRLRSLEMERRLASAQRVAEQRRSNLEDFVSTLEMTTTERDDARNRMRDLTTKVGQLTADVEEIRTHQSRVMAQLEEATRISLGELERVVKKSGVEVEGLLREIEKSYSGEGGPFIPLAYVAPAAAEGFPASGEAVQATLERLERINALRIAVERTPLRQPITEAFRYTSGFGPRRHPVTGRWTQHYGLDMAAPRGTPVLTTSSGLVKYAGRNGGYGKMVRIEHEFGFSTYYAHLNRIHVKVGDRVAKGDQIGEVGSTGRSTGNHLHYEIRRNGKPLNPRKFIEAGRNVF